MNTENKGEPKELVIFDICDTLFYSNTTFDFIRFGLEARGDKIKVSLLYLLTTRYSPLFLTLFFWQKFQKKDVAKKIALKLLQGISKKELYSLGHRFLDQYLNHRQIKETQQLLNQFLTSGSEVVLLSASIDPVVAAIAQQLGVQFRSSRLAYDENGLCRGEVEIDLTGMKLNEARNLMGGRETTLVVATDNFSDRGLVEAAAKRYVVVYNAQAQDFWKDLNPEFITLFVK